MVLAKRIRGSQFTQDDVLEITYTGTDTLFQMTNSIEIVSGVGITHGGGAPAGEFLNFKKEEDTDFSSLEMILSQTEQGSSVIKVVSKIITQSAADETTSEIEAWMLREEESLKTDPNKEAYTDWRQRKGVAEGAEEEFTEVAPTLVFNEDKPLVSIINHSTGEITIDWNEDEFV